jgi:hypothetical protein
MSKETINNELRYNQEKLRLANATGDGELKKKGSEPTTDSEP